MRLKVESTRLDSRLLPSLRFSCVCVCIVYLQPELSDPPLSAGLRRRKSRADPQWGEDTCLYERSAMSRAAQTGKYRSGSFSFSFSFSFFFFFFLISHAPPLPFSLPLPPLPLAVRSLSLEYFPHLLCSASTASAAAAAAPPDDDYTRLDRTRRREQK